MRTKLILTLAAGLAISGMAVLAQEKSTPAAGDKPAATTGSGGETIVLDEVPLVDAIKTLARQAAINVVLDPKVTSPVPLPDGRVMTPTNAVSLRLENVTAADVLDTVLEMHSLMIVKDPRKNIARVTVKDPQTLEPLDTQVFQLKYASPTNIIAIIQPTLSARGRVFSDPRTSQLIVLATRKELDSTKALLDQLDSPTKQVLIEGQIVETRKNPSTVKGVDWSGTLKAQNLAFGNNALPGTPAIPPSGNSPGTPATVGGILRNPGLIASSAGGFTPETFFLNADGVKAVLSFLNSQEDSEIVAQPRAVTLDNQPAALSVTRAFPVFKITPGSANSPAGAEITYTNVGTILTVTPRIAADNNINLKVVPEVSNIDGQDTQILNDTVNRANIYAIRRIETSVLIPSGNTLVMGGLINNATKNSRNKVPVLGDIPGLGWFFRYESKSRDKSNLLIFVTPTIVTDDSFQPTQTDFLKTKPVDIPDDEWSAWDSAVPHDWKKPVY